MIGDESSTVTSKGTHLMKLGFLEQDPASEMSNSGILSLWMILYFYHHNSEQALKVFHESKTTEGGYLFASICIEITTWLIAAIKKGKLDSVVENVDPIQQIGYEVSKHGFIQMVQQVFTGLMYKWVQNAISVFRWV